MIKLSKLALHKVQKIIKEEQQINMIKLSKSALHKVQEIIKKEQQTNPQTKYLRTFVQGGGCSGFSYGFSLEDQRQEDDFCIQIGDIEIVVDGMSIQYLDECEIDYKDDLDGSQFVIKNPKAVTTCGCGSSFSPF